MIWTYVFVGMSAICLLAACGVLVSRRAARRERVRSVEQYDATLRDVGIDDTAGGSLGDLRGASAVEDDHANHPRPADYYDDNASMFAPWRANRERE